MNQTYYFLNNRLLFPNYTRDTAQEGFVNPTSSYPGDENDSGWKEVETRKISANQNDQLPLI